MTHVRKVVYFPETAEHKHVLIQQRLCEDCRHCIYHKAEYSPNRGYFCYNPEVPSTSKVENVRSKCDTLRRKPSPYDDADEKLVVGLCGPEGKLWEPQPPKIPKLLKFARWLKRFL
jgi:uncharacterized protein YlaI